MTALAPPSTLGTVVPVCVVLTKPGAMSFNISKQHELSLVTANLRLIPGFITRGVFIPHSQ